MRKQLKIYLSWLFKFVQICRPPLQIKGLDNTKHKSIDVLVINYIVWKAHKQWPSKYQVIKQILFTSFV